MIDMIASNTWLMIALAIIVGLVIGSFLNVVIHRLPKMLEHAWQQECLTFLGKETETPKKSDALNLATPPSHCPHCQAKLIWWENIPIFSYLILRGQCAHCQKPIAIRYLLVELLTVVLTVIAFWQLGLSSDLIAVLIFTFILIAISFIDIEHQILPDVLSLALLWLGLFLSCFDLFVSSSDAILGAIIGYSFLWIIDKLFKLMTHREGIGHGDFKLMAAIGAWVGWQVLPCVILISSVTGLVAGVLFLVTTKKSRQTPIPFGPFIAMAGFISLIWGFDIMQHYLSFFNLPLMTNL